MSRVLYDHRDPGWHRVKQVAGNMIGKRIRLFIGIGCLTVWLTNVAYRLFFQPFYWDTSLPLQFCQIANLIGAMAVFGKGRLFKGVTYFGPSHYAAGHLSLRFLSMVRQPSDSGSSGPTIFLYFWQSSKFLFYNSFAPIGWISETQPFLPWHMWVSCSSRIICSDGTMDL